MLNKYKDVICGRCVHLGRRRDPLYRDLQHPVPAGDEPRPGVHAQSRLHPAVHRGRRHHGGTAFGEAKRYVPEEITPRRRLSQGRQQESAVQRHSHRFYVFSMGTLGFVISTLIYELCQMIILTPVGKKKNYCSSPSSRWSPPFSST